MACKIWFKGTPFLYLHIAVYLQITPKPEVAGSYKYSPTDLKVSNPELVSMWGLISSTLTAYCPLFISAALNLTLVIFLNRYKDKVQGMRRAKGGGGSSTSSVSANTEEVTGTYILLYTSYNYVRHSGYWHTATVNTICTWMGSLYQFLLIILRIRQLFLNISLYNLVPFFYSYVMVL